MTEVDQVIVERLPGFESVPLPRRATDGSACFDLHAAEEITLRAGVISLVRTGLKMRAPRGTFLEVRPRSGLSARGVLMANAPGTIDRDYSDEVRVPLTFLFTGEYRISTGDRIAQLRVVGDRPSRFVDGRVRPSRTRAGGFGSTGR